MKRTIYGLLAVLALLLQAPTPVYSQDHSNIVREVKDRLQAQGANLSGACGAFAITNRVALELQGYRLLRKSGGNRAVILPDGRCLDGDPYGPGTGPGYATDYLISVNEGFVGYDLLGDGGGANNPQWNGPEGGADIVQRNVNNNSTPVGEPAPIPVPVPVPTPVPTPVPPVIVPPSSTPEVVSLLQQIINLQQSQFDAIIRVEQTALDTNVHVKNMDRTLTQTLGTVMSFVGKYIAPAVAGYLTARQLQGSKTPAVAQ